jgi:hypothetical protein
VQCQIGTGRRLDCRGLTATIYQACYELVVEVPRRSPNEVIQLCWVIVALQCSILFFASNNHWLARSMCLEAKDQAYTCSELWQLTQVGQFQSERT